MRVISRRTLREFWEEHPDAEQSLKAWFHEAENASWRNPAEIKDQYGSASILKRSRVVFNIGGNKYRLVISINYSVEVIYIRFIGTHKEYDTINAETI
jgi:mRNA interferase HigB